MRKIILVVTTAFLSLVSSAQVDLKKGLMMYLPFNGNTLDESTNGNNAVNYGAVLTTDQWGRANSAYYFDGISNFMQIASNATLHPSTAITLSARVKVNGFYDGLCYGNNIIATESDGVAGTYFLRFSPTNGLGCYMQDTNNQNYYGSTYNVVVPFSAMNFSPYIKTNVWDCLIFSFDGTTAKMYVNGILRFTKTASGSSIGASSADVFLGKILSDTYPYWFKGSMDEVRIYNRGLNTAEIDSLCSNAAPLAIQETALPKVLPIEHNPVQTTLSMSLSPADMGGSFRLIDMSGRVLIEIPVLQNTSIPLSDIAPGFYLADYRKDDKQMLAKIVKQ